MTITRRDRQFGRGACMAITAIAALALAACSSGGTPSGPTAEPTETKPFYEGKTIELIVPSAAGTGNDTTARWLAEMLSEYVPGQPRIQVINIEGAGGSTAANEFAGADPDGLTWFISGEANTLAYLLETDGVAYDYANWSAMVGYPSGSIVYMRPGAGGVDDAERVLEASQTLILGGEENAGTTSRALSLDLLGVDYQLVTGYGGNRAEIALQQGEIDISGANTANYLDITLPLVEEGKVLPLFTQGYRDESGELVEDPSAPNVQILPELYESIHGEAPSGDEWDALELIFDSTRSLTRVLWTHGDAPEAAITAVEEGVKAMEQDPGYEEGVSTILGGYGGVTGDQLEELMTTMLEPDPATLDWLRAYTEQLYG